MDPTKLKAHIFDVEQALNWTRQAIEEKDYLTAYEAARQLHRHTGETVAILDKAEPFAGRRPGQTPGQ